VPAPAQQDITLESLNQRIWDHLEARDWHENPTRSLAISVVLEASELLEHYQWSDRPVGSKEDIGDELADILIYAFQIAQREGLDIAHHIERKLQTSAEKYPAENFKGKDARVHREAWLQSKLNYKKDTL